MPAACAGSRVVVIERERIGRLLRSTVGPAMKQLETAGGSRSDFERYALSRAS
jgi:hypothetical protein